MSVALQTRDRSPASVTVPDLALALVGTDQIGAEIKRVVSGFSPRIAIELGASPEASDAQAIAALVCPRCHSPRPAMFFISGTAFDRLERRCAVVDGRVLDPIEDNPGLSPRGPRPDRSMG